MCWFQLYLRKRHHSLFLSLFVCLFVCLLSVRKCYPFGNVPETTVSKSSDVKNTNVVRKKKSLFRMKQVKFLWVNQSEHLWRLMYTNQVHVIRWSKYCPAHLAAQASHHCPEYYFCNIFALPRCFSPEDKHLSFSLTLLTPQLISSVTLLI